MYFAYDIDHGNRDLLVAGNGENVAVCFFGERFDSEVNLILWDLEPESWEIEELDPETIGEILEPYDWVTLSPPMSRGERFKVIRTEAFLEYLSRSLLERENI